MAAFAFVLLPGVGARDPRIVADPHVMPWAAVARLQVPGVSRCTAVIVAPNFAVTAAHCLTKAGLGHFVQPGSIHLLLGYDAGSFVRHIVPDAVILPAGADASGLGPRAADFAVLHFAGPARDVLPLDVGAVTPGAGLYLAGFNQDRVERLGVDPGCRALGYVRGSGDQPLLAHDCTGTRGTSGGPVLVADGHGAFRVVGIQVAAHAGTGGVAVPAAAVAALLPP